MTDVTVKRSLYGLAGQAIATRVVSNPAQGTDGLFYFLGDHLGSTRLLTNTGGTPIADTKAHFLPYGSYRGGVPINDEITDTGFTGHKHNDSLGLVYMNARFYVPGTGRFLTADTIVPDLTDPQSMNRYTYVLGNPLRYSDPTGHLSEDEIRQYFFAESREEMLGWGWSEDLVDWLWDPDVTWGNVFTYNDGDEAMLVFAEMFDQYDNPTETFRGSFYGLNGENTGKFIWPGEILSVDDHTVDATNLESYYHENYDSLPWHNPQYSSGIYTPVMYTDASTAAVGYAGAGLATVGVVATGAIVIGACVSNPIGWAGCGGAAVAALGGGLGLTSAAATVGGAILTAIAPPDPAQYPVLSVSYSSNLTGWGLPAAYTYP